MPLSCCLVPLCLGSLCLDTWPVVALCEALCNMCLEKCSVNKDYYYIIIIIPLWSMHTHTRTLVNREITDVNQKMYLTREKMTFDRSLSTNEYPSTSHGKKLPEVERQLFNIMWILVKDGFKLGKCNIFSYRHIYNEPSSFNYCPFHSYSLIKLSVHPLAGVSSFIFNLINVNSALNSEFGNEHNNAWWEKNNIHQSVFQHTLIKGGMV